ncbi:PREDICTED: poly [ADP-ribose] polymerase 14-like [Gekko japonicus]|uniref:Poly [ADP-ribose] polymerase n=1 Tax=Gekko japonicus TaxID=146911 RepID=A0ABM1KNZ4_GEKJA|nr:PREDICTED: poly [ADP-ribose] polymerase 14-like [Gekko japonicus]
MDWDHLEVNIQVQPDSQILSLKVSGVQKFVREAIPVMKTDLDSLVLGKLPLKKVALGEYFSGAGAETLHEMAQEQHCIARLEMQRSPGRCDGVANTSGDGEQGLAEISCAVIHAVGQQRDVTLFKQDVADFLADFHEETVCSTELPSFGDEALHDLCKNTPHQFPVALCYLREKVVRVCGSREDVEDVLGAIYAKIEEATHAKIEQDHQEWLESKLLHETVQWHHMTEAGWSTFDTATNYHLEKAYRKKKRKAQLQWEGQEIRIDLLKNEAFAPSPGATFKLRREICLWDKNIAPHWEAMDQCLVKKVELQKSSEEYQDIVKNFIRTGGGFKILKVERIQNRYLWVSYCWKRSWMDKKNPEGVQNERILYHGTCPENSRSIQEIGFKSACRKVGLYGQGIYFAKNADRSAFYAKPDSEGHRFVFQTRVLTGEYTGGGEKMVLPPMKPGGKGRYDSLVDVLSKPATFVTFFDDHAYPEYLITFCGSPP